MTFEVGPIPGRLSMLFTTTVDDVKKRTPPSIEQPQYVLITMRATVDNRNILDHRFVVFILTTKNFPELMRRRRSHPLLSTPLGLISLGLSAVDV